MLLMIKSITIAAVASLGLFACSAAHAAGSCGVYPGGAQAGQPIPGSCSVVSKIRTGGMNGAGQTCNVFQTLEDGIWYAIYDLDPVKDLKQQMVTASYASTVGAPLEIWPVGVADFYAEGGHQLRGTDNVPFPTVIYCNAPINGSPGPAIPMTVVAVMYSWPWY
jgi:hypothetical protein